MRQRPDWSPRVRPPYNGAVFRYVPHNATDPLDGTFAMRVGGRWNPPDSFLVLYTSCSITVAIANLWRRFEGEAVQPWEIAEERQADLYELEVHQPDLIDVVTAGGIGGVGLRVDYPEGVAYAQTQAVGARLHREAHPGVWCRSAALASGEEIALFPELANRPKVAGTPKRLWEWFPVPADEKPSS